ncbi:hypothetical protein PCANC_08960 [Puccinia coronata f. sp. avenae]|uniref:Core-binding (CB) domain-containing protein n=1 Tax=Puccinia coronata f. sp. avenae TaxID=200324 RepID=A0A2N5T2G4_9BASI|nr:hypothetical protein PCANC_08960 [Puccinia coronata f. sp. avenae]
MAGHQGLHTSMTGHQGVYTSMTSHRGVNTSITGHQVVNTPMTGHCGVNRLARPVRVPARRAASLLAKLVPAPPQRPGSPTRQEALVTAQRAGSPARQAGPTCQAGTRTSPAKPIPAQQAGQPARWAGAGTSPTIRSTCLPLWYLHQPGEQVELLAELVPVPAQYQLAGLVQVPAPPGKHTPAHRISRRAGVYLIAKSPWRAVVYPLAQIPWRVGVYRPGRQGLLASVLTCLPEAYGKQVYRPASQEPLMGWVKLKAKRLVPQAVKDNLKRWKESLLKYESTRLIPDPDVTNVEWFGDTSTSFGIGILIEKKWAHFKLVHSKYQTIGNLLIAWLETVVVRLGLLILLQLAVTLGKQYAIYTDNTTTLSIVRQRSSKDNRVNKEWMVIQDILITQQINIHTERVASANNQANALSRGKREDHPLSTQMEVPVPEDLCLSFKIRPFLCNGNQSRNLSTKDVWVLEVWRPSTVTSYSTAIKKFDKFMKQMGATSYTLPLNPLDIYRFATWAGRGSEDNSQEKITANSLNKYLFALKAWNMFHNAAYPYQTEKRVKLMIKASGKINATFPQTPGKSPILISDLKKLVLLLYGKGPEAAAVVDLAIVAFWGMVQMAELTWASNNGPLKQPMGPAAKDVSCYSNLTILCIHKVKTAQPGKVQELHLRPLRGALCPFRPMKRRLATVTSPSNSLFGFPGPQGRVHLTKCCTNAILNSAWHTLGQPSLSSHSFWVGGASLKNA